MHSTNRDVDLELARQIQHRLERHPHFRLQYVSCETNAGQVKIRGRVNSYFEKQMAQEALRSVQGIVSIDNELNVDW